MEREGGGRRVEGRSSSYSKHAPPNEVETTGMGGSLWNGLLRAPPLKRNGDGGTNGPCLGVAHFPFQLYNVFFKGLFSLVSTKKSLNKKII